MTRLLAIMGSGETSPTMIKPHRALLERVGARGVGSPHGVGPAVMLDTPFGFQENASEIAEKAIDYFAKSVGTPIEVTSMRTGTFETEAGLAALRRAVYVFAGPGSPTYALDQWEGSPVPDLLREKLRDGGVVTFASAAALTLGVATVPVYEIYKVGVAPFWRDGLDLLAEAGLRAAVIPHYNNAEGGTHDTRFCYLGERRLAMLEDELPDGAFVLGVDEHTGAIIDLDADTMEIVGVGLVTARRHGESVTYPAGETIPLETIRSGERNVAPGGRLVHQNGGVRAGAAVGGASPSPLLGRMDELEAAFEAAVGAGDGAAAGAAVLEAEEELHTWAQYESDEVGKARMRLRGMIVRLATGVSDPTAAAAPFVDALLAVRDASRAAKDFATADLVRDRLVEAGVEVGDSKEGTTWRLLS
jgi:hypothetical protein